jgi:predicted transcriptional regulator
MPSKSKNLYKDDSVILDLLSLMETDRNITQRNLARDLNIALGLVNLYVKKCIDKGLLKINQIPSKRYKYYITKKGFIEKARLTQEYFKTSFNFYRKAKEELGQLFYKMEKDKIFRVILSDISEISDIAILTAVDSKVEIVAIITNNHQEKFYRKVPLINNLNECEEYDVVLLTSLSNSEKRYKQLLKTLKAKQLVVPSFLKINSKKGKK